MARFVREHILPAEQVFLAQQAALPSRWTVPAIVEELKAKARAEGLWNLFLPSVSGLSQLEYAGMAELMGRSLFASEVFNCSAPG